MRRRGGAVIVVVGAAALAACGGDAPEAPVAATAAPTAVLAPSQTTPDTVAPPDAPPPCVPAALTYGASSPLTDAGLVIRVVNTGAERCEANFGSSPIVDPAMEPDVWLDAGGAGELAVAVDTASCDEPGPVQSVGLVMNGEPVAVEIDPIDACLLTLTALYPAD